VFVPVNNRSTETIQRVKRRIVADQIGRAGRMLGAHIHTDSYSGTTTKECIEITEGYSAKVVKRLARDSSGAEHLSTTIAAQPMKSGPVSITKQTERYLLCGCVAEMTLLTMPALDDEMAPQQYATVAFQGETSFMVYEAAEAAGVPSLARFALCGDRHAGTLLGQMGMTYAGFVASAPLAGQPALLTREVVRTMEGRMAAGPSSPLEQMGTGMPELSTVSPTVLKRYLQRLFAIADEDSSGDLDYSEFSKLLRCSGFALDKQTRRKILSSVRMNNRGRVTYNDFIPVAMEILGVPLPETMAPATQALDLATVSASAMETYLKRLFSLGDTNGDGVLSPDELEVLLRKSGFQFTDKVVEEMIQICDVNHDGVIEYHEFVPMMTAMLTM